MTTEELSQLRGTLRDAPQEEHDAFRQEWRSRLDGMTAEERQQYAGCMGNCGQEQSDAYCNGCRGGKGRRCQQ